MIGLLRSALKRISSLTALVVWLGDAMLVTLFGAWLQIPDSHAWQFVLSMLALLVLLVGLLWVQAFAVRRLRGASVAVWLSMVVLAAWLLLTHVLQHASGMILNDAMRRAGYINSQLGPGLRRFFTFERLLHWQGDFVDVLVLGVIPALVLPFLIETVARGVSGKSWKTALDVLLRWQHWVTVLLAAWIGYWITTWTMGWIREGSPAVEVMWLVVRVTFVSVVDVALLLFVAALDAELLHRRQVTAGEPAA